MTKIGDAAVEMIEMRTVDGDDQDAFHFFYNFMTLTFSSTLAASALAIR